MFLPFVYHWRRGTESLYIGISRYGWQRLLSSHKIVTRSAVQDSDTIDIYYCDSPAEALILESELIKHFTPRYNVNAGGKLPRKPDFRLSPEY